MMRIASVAALLASSDGHRLDVVAGTDSSLYFFENCNELQTMFQTRLDSIQAIQDAHTETAMNARTRARFTMRALGAVRTLRRAKECPWLVKGNAEDIARVHDAAQSVLAEHPCGETALSALSVPASGENPIEPLQHAVEILYSEQCEPAVEATIQTRTMGDNNMENSQMLMDAEDAAQDRVDELMDAAAAEEESLAAGAFIQTEGIVRGVLNMLGAVFLSMLYLLFCASVAAVIVAVIGFIFGLMVCSHLPLPAAMTCWTYPIVAVGLTGVAGLASCGLDMARAHGNTSQFSLHPF